MGCLVHTDEEREQLVDEFLETKQYKEGGLLGSITHLGDGEVPQEALAVVGGENALPKSMLEQLLDG